MTRLQRLVTSALTTMLVVTSAVAQMGGGVPVRVPLGGASPECINSSTDRVWVTLYRVITAKNAHFFSSERQAEIIVNVGIKTDPQTSPAINYPLSATVNISDYPNGQVSIPVEYTVVSGLPLEQEVSSGQTVIYTGFALDATLVNLHSRNGLGSGLEALASVTGATKLPIPNTPYTQAASYLLQFANSAVNHDIQSKNANDKFTTASLALNFDPEGQCNGFAADGQGFETTGVKAIIMATGVPGAGLVPLANIGDYCFSAQGAPAFTLRAAPRSAGVPCTDPSYAVRMKTVTNDYMAFVLWKRNRAAHLGAMTPLAEKERRQAQEICTALSLTPCVAAE